MPRKIIKIITPHYTPEITAAAHRMEAAAKVLSTSFIVHVFSLTERGSKTETHSFKCDENLTLHYISVRSYNKSIFLLRAFFECWYSFKLVRKSNKIKSDLAIVTIPFMFLLPFVIRYCKTKKKIADVRDLVWHYLKPQSYFKKIVSRKITSIMHNALKKFDAITVTNESERTWLKFNSNISGDKILVIPNGIGKEKAIYLAEMKYSPHPQKFTITYVGNIGTSQNFYPLVDAVKEINDVRLNLIGDGNEFLNLKKYISDNKITNVSMPGKLRWKRTLPYYQTSNLLFASLKDEFDTAVPSKLYEYLSTGLPILFQGNGIASEFLLNYKNTFVINNNESKEIERLIWKIKKLTLSRSIKNIQSIERNFLREKLSMRFVEQAARLLNERTLSDLFVEDILLRTEL